MMDELSAMGTASWLPAGIQRSLALEAAADARAEREAAAEAEARAEERHEAALVLARSQAEARGEFLDPLAFARGEGLGRTVGEVLGQAAAEADMADAREAGRQAREARGGPAHAFVDEPPVGRSDGWPGSGYEVDRLVRAAEDDRQWMAAYRMRLASRQGRAAGHIEAQRQAANAAHSPNPGRAVNPAAVARGWCDEDGEIRRGYAAPPGATWGQISDWVSRGWRP